MNRLSDSSLERLRRAADRPDLSATQYEIVDELGRGGMGTVYRVRDRNLEREVALKVITLADDAGDLGARMRSEARILASLDHAGIVPVHDVGVLPDGRTFYVMKLVRGTRLDEHVSALATTAARLRVFERICETVAFAHAHGVVHRDLKPGNVMVGAFGEVLVLDWGVATVFSRERGGEQARRGPTGTPGYMAPEQESADVEIDERSDVYSLGALLLFLLTQRHPPELRDRVAEIDARLAALRGVPAPLRAICRRALEPDRELRYTRVDDLVLDVARFLAGASVSAYRESHVERARRVIVRYRAPILLVLAYLLMRIVLLFVRGT